MVISHISFFFASQLSYRAFSMAKWDPPAALPGLTPQLWGSGACMSPPGRAQLAHGGGGMHIAISRTNQEPGPRQRTRTHTSSSGSAEATRHPGHTHTPQVAVHTPWWQTHASSLRYPRARDKKPAIADLALDRSLAQTPACRLSTALVLAHYLVLQPMASPLVILRSCSG